MAKKRRRSSKKKENKNIFVLLGKILWWLLKGMYYAVYYVFYGIYWLVRWMVQELSKLLDFKDADKSDNSSKASKKSSTDKSSHSLSSSTSEKKSSAATKSKSDDEQKEASVAAVRHGEKKHEASNEEFSIIETLSGDFAELDTLIFTKKSTIGIVLGARGTGKSALGLRLCENIFSRSERPIFVMGFDPKELPKWITVVKDPSYVDNGAFLLVDESGISFSSRRAMSNANKLLSDLLLVARHKDLSVLFITQNSSNLELNILRQADYMLLKPHSLLQRDFERKKIKDMYDTVHEQFEKYKDDIGLTYVFSSSYRGFVSNGLPSFWSTTISKAFKEK